MDISAVIAKPEYDNIIKQNPSGSTYPWSASTGVLDANFADTIGTTDSIQIFTQGYTFAWKPDTVNVIDDTDAMTLLENVNPNAAAQVWNNKVTYVGTTLSTSDEFVVDGNQLKHSVHMVAPPRLPSGFSGTPKYLAIGGDIGTTAQDWADIELIADGESHLSDFVTSDDLKFCLKEDGKEVYRIPHITITDNAGNETSGQYKLVFNSSDSVTLYMLCPWDWLQQAQYPIIIDPTVVVSSGYDTSGANGRKIVRLSNNAIIIGAMSYTSSGNVAHFFSSSDNGQTWSEIKSYTVNTQTSQYVHGIAITSQGTTVYFAIADQWDGSGTIVTGSFDQTNVSGTFVANSSFTNQGIMASNTCAVSIEMDGTGALGLSWSSVQPTYPNSYNIRYSKGTVSGTTVTWASPTQVTTYNTTGQDVQNPCILVNSSNVPVILGVLHNSPLYLVISCTLSSSWSVHTVYIESSGSYVQANPSGLYDTNGVIRAVWHGYDPTYTATFQIKYATSSDGGTTWSSVTTLTAVSTSGQHQQNATITLAPNTDDLYVFFQGIDASKSASYYNIRMIKYSSQSASWGSISNITSNTTASAQNPQSLWSEFNMNSSDAIRMIYQDSQAGSVEYYTITLDSSPNAPVLNPVANFDATKATTFSWAFSDPDPGDTQSAFQLQVVDVSNPNTPVVDTGKVASTNTSYTVSANTLSNAKQYQWRVTTWDSQGAQGPYSSYGTFNTAGAPTTTVTNPMNNGTVSTSSLTAQWSYSDPNSYVQKSFQVQLLASDDLTVLADSGTVTSSGNQYTIPYTLANNTTYFVSVRTTNSQGVTSAWASSTFSTSFTLPQQPSVTASSLSTSAKITIAMTNYASKNLALNSGFEDVTTTATLFSDALTSYSGSTVPAPWTLDGGSFTFGASGATSGASGSMILAGNSVWRPLLGSDGSTKLSLTAQASYTTPATINTADSTLFFVNLFIDNSNTYHTKIDPNANVFYLYKQVSGTWTVLASVSFTPSASTSYTLTLSRDPNGVLTAKVTPSGGSTTTLTATDTSLTGGFLIGVGGDTGVVISNASVTAPWANSWTIGGDSRVAWGLTQSAIGGKYSVSAVGVGQQGYASQTISISTSTTYTFSMYASTTNAVSGLYSRTSCLYFGSPATVGTLLPTGTTASQRYENTVTSNSTSTLLAIEVYGTGTYTFDNIQLEQGSLSPYIENDNTSSPQQAPAIAYNDIYRRNTGTSAWTRIATNISASGTYDDYAVASGQGYDYKVTAIGNNGTQVDSAVVSTSVSFTGDWLYNPTSGQQFQFLYNRKAYSLAITEERKEVQTFGTKPMIRRGPLNARTGTLDALMVKIGTGQTPIQQLQAFESDMAPHNAYYLKTAAGEVFKVDIHNAKRSMPAENLNSQAIGVSVDWTEVA